MTGSQNPLRDQSYRSRLMQLCISMDSSPIDFRPKKVQHSRRKQDLLSSVEQRHPVTHDRITPMRRGVKIDGLHVWCQDWPTARAFASTGVRELILSGLWRVTPETAEGSLASRREPPGRAVTLASIAFDRSGKLLTSSISYYYSLQAGQSHSFGCLDLLPLITTQLPNQARHLRGISCFTYASKTRPRLSLLTAINRGREGCWKAWYRMWTQ
ncbi:hypothetical protein M8818_001216 [Zalaria obscura]|uniref:Uncharacterized protein n=1 Tax=Zalaria obscura TaxID=2024903 RepID=A0ACC3SL55_9PEZI